MASAPPTQPVWQEKQPTGAIPSDPGSPAGFWIRVAAAMIDGLIVSIPAVVIFCAPAIVSYFVRDKANGLVDGAVVLATVALIVGNWLYFALLESSGRKATLGKTALGLRVVTGRGERLGFLDATKRFFAKWLSSLILGIGFLMVAFTSRKRGLHDFMADTLVIKSR
jgi:uncharacterized RDD family membrane protein YckC